MNTLRTLTTAAVQWPRLARWRRTRAVDGRSREGGQVLALFAVMSIVLLGGAALISDAAWWWTSEQQMQRAADAAALAGAIYLPENQIQAYASARDEAKKNGFAHEVGGITVTPRRDPANTRKLIVDVSGTVSTHFARVLGLQEVAASATGAAEYVLPVPMGSPENYYGVGFFQGVTPAYTPPPVLGDTGWGRVATFAPSGGEWARYPTTGTTTTIVTVVNATDAAYANENTNGQRQSWSGFGLATTAAGSPIANPAANQSVVINGIEVRLGNTRVSANCANSTVDVQLSWDGANPDASAQAWSTAVSTPLLTRTSVTHVLPASGGPTSTTAWGTDHTWIRDDFSNGNFQVRLTARKGCPTTSTQLRVDRLEVRVYYTLNTNTVPESYHVLSVPDPGAPPSGTLATQGFWGAIFTSGGVRENGDRYAPLYVGGNNPPDGVSGGPNPNYDANGYEYTIEVGANGQVRLFDPVFCATGENTSGAWFGTGDHWTTDGTGGSDAIGPVSVRFRLINTKGTPHTTIDDQQAGPDLVYDPGSATLGDFSGNFNRADKPPQNYGRADAQDCASHPAHNQWVLPTGWSGLTAGTYRLNVNTNLGQNANHGAENLFAIWVKGDSRARVYGGGRMAAYTNLDATGAGGPQKFFFAQIDARHAGKTMTVTLFDPGEANANSYLRFLSPQGGTYHYATFNWSANNGTSGTGVTQIQTATPSGGLFNNRIVTIEIPLDFDYATAALDPDGLGEDGWWKVEYDVRAANDTTTWEVEINGNPVRLVME